MKLLALDLSLSRIGWAALHAPPVASGTFDPPGEGVARLAAVQQWIAQQLRIWDPALVLIEGYSFGSEISRAHALGELGGAVQIQLHHNRLPFVIIPPKSRAKLATGNGNASKDEVLAATIRRMKDFRGFRNDEADALWLLEAARQAYLLPSRLELPQGHLEALKKIEWPRIAA